MGGNLRAKTKLYALPAVALLGFFCAVRCSREAVASGSRTTAASEPLRVSARDLVRDYADTRAGNARWQGRRVHLVGTVNEVVRLADGRAVVILRGGSLHDLEVAAGTVNGAEATKLLAWGDRAELSDCTVAGKLERVGLLGCHLAISSP
jgi:hypothetical protein